MLTPVDEMRQRRWRVRIGTALPDSNGVAPAIEFDSLQIEFDIKKSLRPEPNSCKLRVYNLNAEHRAAISALNLYDPKKVRGQKKPSSAQAKKPQGPRAPKVGRIRVEIEAGYESTGMSLLFRGDLRRAISTHEGPHWITEIEGEDGGRSILSSRITESFPPGTTRLEVVRACADALGLGLGNIRDVQSYLDTPYEYGTVCSGAAHRELVGVLRSAGITVSVQNGVLQFLRVASGLQREAVYLSPDTGLIDSPRYDSSGTVLATALLIPDLSPGCFVVLKSRDFDDQYKVVSVRHEGKSAGSSWYHHLELAPA